MGIRVPFRNIQDKKVRDNFEAIHVAPTLRVHENTQVAVPGGEKGTVVLYAVDNGAGKLKLMAQHPTGAPVQLSIEP
jgi:hypothetical protein